MEATRVAALLLATGVAAGAFGAHGLEGHVSADRLDTWHTGALYHLLHGVALLALASLSPSAWVSRLLLGGTLIFSGSLYLLVLTDTGWLGAITPVGGVLMIAGWALLAVQGTR